MDVTDEYFSVVPSSVPHQSIETMRHIKSHFRKVNLLLRAYVARYLSEQRQGDCKVSDENKSLFGVE